ncbi:PAS domain-containing protein [Leptolyngbya sp. FACHB-16]|uniref:PAS domain-containing protein n=1 Tax=unclassified Leptolyngbya TaxID=2650499 RepID=UPI001687D156|nr:PAS domain-containing protein [Leptolyngbya sp. FACHB-16]MBD2158953.1 PAS domain-containing protein [Leptolyngbya sp. FACHB-16]
MIQHRQASDQRFAGDSTIATEIRSHNWSQTSLGSIEAWPPSLKTTLNILFHTPYPMFLAWGSDRILFYNDACSSLLGQGQGPQSLSQPINDTDGIWPMVSSMVEQVFATGQSVQRNQRLPARLDHNTETPIYTWFYNPLWDSDGQISGVFATGIQGTASSEGQSFRVNNDLVEPQVEEGCIPAILGEHEDFRDVFTVTSVGMAQADIKTRQLLHVNAAFCSITGYTEAELLELRVDDIAHPDEREGDRQRFARLLSGETTTYQAEKRYLHKDGSIIWVLVTGNVAVDANGRSLLIAVIQDITERKQAEDDLRKSEERFRRVTQAVDGLIFDWNLQTNEVYRSEKLYTLIGVEPENAPPEASWWHERIHPDDVSRLQPRIHELLISAEQLYQTEYRVRHEDGHWVDVWEQSCLIRDEQGQVIRIVGCTVDISDRKRAEYERSQADAALRKGEERLQTALEGSSGGLWDWNITTNETYLSPRWLEMLGYQEGDLQQHAHTWEHMIHPDDKAWVMERTEAHLQDGSVPYKFEYRLLCKTGEWKWIATYGKVVLRDAKGNPLRMAGIHHDISDRKVKELALQRSEERFRISQELSLDAFTTMDCVRDENGAILDFAWTYVNPKAAEILQKPAEALVGQHLLDVFPVNRFNSELFERYVRVVETGESHDIELQYEVNGIIGWFRNMAVKLEDGLAVSFSDITARKQAEAEREHLLQDLATEQARFEAVLRQMPAGVIIAQSPSGQLILGNEQAEQIWRHPLLLADGINEYREYRGFHADGRPYESEEWPLARSLMAGEVVTQEEIRFLRGDDTEGVMEVSSTPIYDRQGQIISGVVVFQDISDRKRIEEALRTSEERLRFAIEGADLGTWEYELGTRKIIWSEQSKMMFGFPLDAEVDYDSFIQAIHADDRDRIHTAVEQTLAQQDIYDAEMRTVWADGSVHWLRSIGRARYDHHGVATDMIGVVLDITNRKQAELEREHLLAREQQYVSQLQGLTAAALAINSALSVEEVLQVITDQAAFIIGAHQSVISMTLNQNWAQAVSAVYLSDKYAQWRDYNTKPDGSGIYACVCHMNHPMRMTQAELEAHPHWKGFGAEANHHPPMWGWLAAPLKGRDGKNIGLIQLSDKFEGEFTEADEAILVQLAQLASVAIENAQLYEAEQQARALAEVAREEAQSANRLKDEFLAVLSHELRSPLNPILGWSKLLQTGQFDEQGTLQALQTIERNAKLQTQLIEDLLDVSRILQGKMALTTCPVNLVSVVESAMETVRLAAKTKAIDLQWAFSDVGSEPNQQKPIAKTQYSQYTVLGDSVRLQQIVWNLLSNAVKFTPGGGHVDVKLEVAMGSYAQITVSDTGKGIKPEFLPYVFDYFRQEDGTTTRKFGGLGLGLAIVRYLTELHGGTIQVESAGEGQGAVFTVRFPLLHGAVESGKAIAPSSSLNNFSHLSILAVDDEADMRDLVQVILEQQNVHIRLAASATEALAMFDEQQPDILISDIGMPEMDGYQLIQTIRQRSPKQGGLVPAIALTAYAGEYNQQRALNAGFQQHVSKPIEPEELITAIAELVNPGRELT